MLKKFISVALYLALGAILLCAQTGSGDSSSATRATPSPTPAVHKPKPSPERDAAMATGERLLFKSHDLAKSVDEFKKVIKIDPWYGQGYMLLGLAQMQLQHWSEAQWA